MNHNGRKCIEWMVVSLHGNKSADKTMTKEPKTTTVSSFTIWIMFNLIIRLFDSMSVFNGFLSHKMICWSTTPRYRRVQPGTFIVMIIVVIITNWYFHLITLRTIWLRWSTDKITNWAEKFIFCSLKRCFDSKFYHGSSLVSQTRTLPAQ